MKKVTLLTQVVSTIFIFSLLVFSCKKETSQSGLSPQEEEQASVATAQADAESDVVFNDVFDNVMGVNNDVGLQGTGIFERSTQSTISNEVISVNGCFTVFVTHLLVNEPFPLRIVIDFGTGCTGRDGHTRKGKIITEYTGRLIIPGKSATTTFENYQFDSLSVEGTHKITNTSTADMRQFTVDITGAKLSRPNGNYSKWTSHREIKQVEGLGTPELPIDDVFTITGHASGEVKTNDFVIAWESNIIEPLRKRFACHWISKGIAKVVRKNLSTDSKWAATLNYGNGECDNKASLTINGQERQITL